MGIDGFGTFLRKRSPDVFRHLASSALAGRRVALDMHFYTYQMFFRNGGASESLDRDVRMLMQRIRQYGFTAVFVFDGNTVGKKPRAHKKRKDAAGRVQETLSALRDEASCLAVETAIVEQQARDTASSLSTLSSAPPLNEEEDVGVSVSVSVLPTTATGPDGAVGAAGDVGDVGDGGDVVDGGDVDVVDASGSVNALKRRRDHCEALIVKMEARAMKPSSATFADVQHLLTNEFGDEAVVTAEDDAERHVAHLCRTGAVDYAASGDYDTLVFGSPNLILDFLKFEAMTIVQLSDVLLALQLKDLAQFRDFSILCGCDFCEKIPGIGPVKALKLITTHHTIENVYKKLGASTYSIDYGFARERFGFTTTDTTTTPHKSDDDTTSVVWKSEDDTATVELKSEDDTATVELKSEDVTATAVFVKRDLL